MKQRIKRKHLNNNHKRINTEIVLRSVLHDSFYAFDHTESRPKDVPFRYRSYLYALRLNKRHTKLGSSHKKKVNDA